MNTNMAQSSSCIEEERAIKSLVNLRLGLNKIATMRCAVELGIPDIVEAHPDGVTLADLSSEVGCSPEPLRRIMRLLTHHHIFKCVMKTEDQDLAQMITYMQTACSRLLMKNKLAPILMLNSSPEFFASRSSQSKYLLSENSDVSAFEMGNGMNIWQYNAANQGFSELFNETMACHVRLDTPVVIANCREVFEGIDCVVDVGGGDGTTLSMLVKAFPSLIRAINFDLPHVVSPLVNEGCVEHVGGDMFETIPTADSALLMGILHDWDDKSCLKILKNCIKAIPKKTGKVIIVDIVVDDDDDDDLNFIEEVDSSSSTRDTHLAMDIEMMAHTLQGKERTSQEWDRVLKAAGFNKHTIRHIPTLPHSIIQAYP